MKYLFILFVTSILAGCAAPYQYNPNLSPHENAYLELEYRRMQQQAWAQRGAALRAWGHQLNQQEQKRLRTTTQCYKQGNYITCNEY